MSHHDDTIYAVATGVGKSAVAVVRVSGDGCSRILEAICPGVSFPDRKATLAALRDPDRNLLDRALVLRFLAPRSFTGEDMIEFQVTGSQAVLSGLLRTLRASPKVRPAEAGEFARRAFENGKLDLVEVEGLAALVDAETDAQLRHAQRMASGVVSKYCDSARDLLLRTIANVESMLDFSDVEDASALSLTGVFRQIDEAKSVLAEMLAQSAVSERLREGMVVVIAGRPNVGKSTLLNHLAGRDVALVSAIPGTTRDSLEFFADVSGYPVVFIDTAGLRLTSDALESQGIARSLEKAEAADLVLWLSDRAGEEPIPKWSAKRILKVQTKMDLTEHSKAADGAMGISALSGFGISDLIAEIGRVAREHFAGAATVMLGTERQRTAVKDALDALEAISGASGAALELMAEDLRYAASALGRVTGHIGVEEVLDDIFGRLCIGK